MGRFLERKHGLYHVRILINCRYYEINNISADDIASKSQDYAYFHIAVLEKSSDLNVWASCVTFYCQDKVPPGSTVRRQ